MLWKKSGNPLDENTQTCEYCSDNTIFDTDATIEKIACDNESTVYDNADNLTVNIKSQNDYDDNFTDDNFTNSNEFATANFDEPVKKKRKNKNKNKSKSKRKKIILSIVALLLVVVIVFVAMNFSYLLGHFIRIFLGDAAYLKYVELLDIKKTAKCVSNLYTTSSTVLSDDFTKSVQADIITLEELIPGFGAFNPFGNNKDNDSKEESTPDNNTPNTDNNNSDKKDFGLDFMPGNDTTTLSATTVTQADETSANATAQNSDANAEKENSETENKVKSFFINEYTKIFESDAVQNALPSKKELQKLSRKYAIIVCDKITNEHVNGSYKEVTINSTTQKLYVLEFTLNRSTYNAICKDFIEELKKDTVVKELIDGLSLALYNEGYVNEKDALYSHFTDKLNDRLEEVNKSIKANENDVVFTLVDYVNNHHEIVGRDIIKNNKTTFSCVTVTNKNTFANKVVMQNDKRTLTLVGNGTQKGNVVNIEWTLSKDDESIMYVKLNDFNKKQAFDGSPNINLKLTPTGAFIKSIKFPGSDILGSKLVEMLKTQIDIDFSLNKDGALINAKVSAFAKDIVSITYQATKAEK